jgi:hypothetical protein
MGRHGIREAGQTRATRSVATTTTARPASPARPASRATGKILMAAVAAGAVLPAVQAMDTHVADADADATTSGSLQRADLALAAQHQAGRPSARPAASGSVASVAMPAASRSSVGSAGDATDVSSLTKAMSIARENGPVEFGRPYSAGDDDTLDGQIEQALGLLGLPQKLAPGVKKIIMRESTGNPHAVNGWDSNASAGTPSKGLMQLIDTTFRNAVLPSLADKGIFDPVANITAGIRTMAANHGLDAVMDGGLRSSSGGYIGYGGAKLPDDGLGLASRG